MRRRKRTVVIMAVFKTVLGMMIVLVVTVQYRLGSNRSSSSSSRAMMKLLGGDDAAIIIMERTNKQGMQEMDVMSQQQQQQEEEEEEDERRQQLLLPSWMEDYLAWHTETRRRWLSSEIERDRSNISNSSSSSDNNNNNNNTSPRPPPPPKLLILVCTSEQTKCGGLSDRIKPLPLLVLGAYKTKRLLLIYWSNDRPAKLENFLLPPPQPQPPQSMFLSSSTSTSISPSLPVLDWTVPDDIASQLFPVVSSSASNSSSATTTTSSSAKVFNGRRKHLTNTKTFIENLMKFDDANSDRNQNSYDVITTTLQWWDGGYQSYTNERIRMMMNEKTEVEEIDEVQRHLAKMKSSTSTTTTTTATSSGSTSSSTSTSSSKAQKEIYVRQEYYTYYNRLWSRTFRPTQPIQRQLDKIYDEMRRLSSSSSRRSDGRGGGGDGINQDATVRHRAVDYTVAHYRALWWEDQTVPSMELQEEITRHAIDCAVKTKLKFQSNEIIDDDDQEDEQQQASSSTQTSSSSSSLVVYFATDSIDAQQFVMKKGRNNNEKDTSIISSTTMSVSVNDGNRNSNSNKYKRQDRTVDLLVVSVPHKSLVHLDRVRILGENEEQPKKQVDHVGAGATEGVNGRNATTTLVVDKSVQIVHNVEEIYPVFVDLLLLGGGSCISYGDGGYGQFGSLLQQPYLLSMRQHQRRSIRYTNTSTTSTAVTTSTAATKTKKIKPAASTSSASDVPDAMICSKRYIKRHKLQPC